MVLLDSLVYAENIDTNYAIISWTCHLSAIFIYVEILLFWNPPKPLVQFSPNSTEIIFSPCWQKCMDFMLMDKCFL